MACQCQKAVTNTYVELRKANHDEARAFDAAVRVYRHYHPEQRRLDAFQTVADWLDQTETQSTPAD